MRKIMVMVLVSCAVFNQPLEAQNYYYNNKYYDNDVVLELGVSGGVMNSLTDIGGNKGIGKKFIKDLRWKTAKPSYGGYILATYKNVIGVRLEGTFGEVMGYDSILKPVAPSTFGRYERNLSFKSKISEFQLAVEIHPLFFKDYDENKSPFISPYAIAGFGYFSFDPQAKINGQWYALEPLHTEGQGFKEYPDRQPYKLNQFNIALGMGLKYEINSLFNARIELVHRILKTDYLDDVSTSYIDPNLFYNYLTPSQAALAVKLYNRKAELNPGDVTSVGDQRGDPKNNDAYFTIQVKFGMTLGRKSR